MGQLFRGFPYVQDWVFDLRTAILLGALVTEAIAALLLLCWRSLPRAVHPSLRWWLGGLLLHPMGFLLVSLRGVAPPWLSVWLANTALAMALTCMAIALRCFYGLPERRLRLYVTTVLVAVFSVWYELVQPNLQWRVVSVSILLAVLIGSCARAVFRRGGPVGRVPRVTGALFAFATLVMLARAALYSLSPLNEAGLVAATPFNLLAVGSLVLVPILATISFLLMCSERSQEELERTSRLDYLTGIFNRRAIEDLASRAISAARRHGLPLAMLILDVDHFKRINDEHGHEAGDHALIETVCRLRQSMRAEDLIGRQGGEEFVVVMPDVDMIAAHAAAERLRCAFADAPMQLRGCATAPELSVTVSVGVAVLEPGDLQFSQLLRRADRAMYAAKAAGRNRVVLDLRLP
jgi:diguanylate cyclase (GGDEF)-like protein